MATVESTEHISGPCIKGLQEPKTNRVEVHLTSHPPTWNRDPLDTPGVSGVSGPWDPGSVLMGRFWAIEGLQAKRCNNIQGEEKPNPCVSLCAHVCEHRVGG